MEETGKIDGMIGADNVGRIIDLKNHLNDKKKDREYDDKITSMNKYFVKLLLWQIKNPGQKYKSDSILVPRDIN